MGLTNIHLAFIALATMTSLFCGLWLIGTEQGREIEHSAPMAIALLASAPILVIYGVRFIRKARTIDATRNE